MNTLNENPTVTADEVAPTRSLFAGNAQAYVNVPAEPNTPTEAEDNTVSEVEPIDEGAVEVPDNTGVLPVSVADGTSVPETVSVSTTEIPADVPSAEVQTETVEPATEIVDTPVEPEAVSEPTVETVEEPETVEPVEEASVESVDAAVPDAAGKPKTVKELQAEKDALDAQLAARQNEEKKGVIAQIAAVVKTYNISVAELAAALGGVPNPQKGTKAPILFSDGTNNWSGRGRLPKWLKDKNPEDYRIK